jgi:hypothetical protein
MLALFENKLSNLAFIRSTVTASPNAMVLRSEDAAANHFEFSRHLGVIEWNCPIVLLDVIRTLSRDHY